MSFSGAKRCSKLQTDARPRPRIDAYVHMRGEILVLLYDYACVLLLFIVLSCSHCCCAFLSPFSHVCSSFYVISCVFFFFSSLAPPPPPPPSLSFVGAWKHFPTRYIQYLSMHKWCLLVRLLEPSRLHAPLPPPARLLVETVLKTILVSY